MTLGELVSVLRIYSKDTRLLMGHKSIQIQYLYGDNLRDIILKAYFEECWKKIDNNLPKYFLKYPIPCLWFVIAFSI